MAKGGIVLIKKTSFILSVIIVLLALGFVYYNNHSDKGIMENVVARHGYSLQQINNQVAVEFFIKPEWIPFKANEQKKLNVKLLEKNNTIITLDNVWNRGKDGHDIYFSFHVTFTDMKEDNGTFLYNGVFNDDGSFSSSTPWKENLSLSNKAGQKIDLGQTGSGPGSDFSFGINVENQQLLRDGFNVKYSAFNLYQYSRSKA